MLNKVFGFYFEQGSKDFPSNYSLEDPFGFDPGSDTPVFKYSINDVEKSFIKPRQLTTPSMTRAVTCLDTLIVEGNGNIDISSQNISTPAWRKIFEMLEYIYANQATYQMSPSVLYNATNGTGWINKGDEELCTRFTSYAPHSFTPVASDKTTRLASATFRADPGSGGIVEFTIYFDADMTVDRVDGVNFAVYRYEDLNLDNEIDENEFNTQIVTKLFDILNTGRYRQFDKVRINKWVEKIVNGVSSGLYEQEIEVFYVFTSYSKKHTNSPFSQEVKYLQIKNYLRSRYNDEEFLRNTYRELFSDDIVEIIPIYQNTVQILGGELQIVHPISLGLLRETMNSFGKNYNPDANASNYTTYLPTELFYVGTDTDVSSQFGYPIIAVESKKNFDRPISDRFPDFKPLYGVEYHPTSSLSEAFHHFIVLSLSVCTGVIELSSIDLSVQEMINMKYVAPHPDHYNRGYISFSFNGVTWKVYAPSRSI